MSGRSGQPDYAGTIIGPRMVPATNERRTTIFNDTELTSGAPPSNRSANDYGKFFTRGMRGILQTVQLYALGNAVNTVTVNISPQPGLGATYSVTITPLAIWSWVDATFNVMWNYDSLYIWVTACNAAVFWGYDAEPPPDGHYTPDSGATFTGPVERPYIRAVMTGETAGDVPISGIVNTIRIPSASSVSETEDEDIIGGVETDIVTVEGAGYCDLIEFYGTAAASSHNILFRVYCDGALAFAHHFGGSHIHGFNRETVPIALTQYALDGFCALIVTKMFEFTRELRVTAYHATLAQTVSAYVYPILLR